MRISLNGFELELRVIPRQDIPSDQVTFTTRSVSREILEYEVCLDAQEPASVRVEIELVGEDNVFHLIPCNIHGDNNLAMAKPGYFPNLTRQHQDSPSCSGEWEFRADRASHPVSVIACGNGAVGISISPYSPAGEKPEGFIRNGVYSRLDAVAGVSLGYRNIPFTFTNKEDFSPKTEDKANVASATGRIYAFRGAGRREVQRIIRDLYARHRECPRPARGREEYLRAFLHSFETINWSKEHNAFTNLSCKVPLDPVLRPWRPLIEIGWTGTGVVAYPLLAAQVLLKEDNAFTATLTGCFDAMVSRFNERSGLFYDLVRDRNGSPVNGWWAGYMVRDCHCAYTNGNGIYYLLKAYMLLRDKKNTVREDWLGKALLALDTMTSLQKEDGNFGYTYSTEQPMILDEEGFAGVWFCAALALAHSITGKASYLESAKKGLEFYHRHVKALECWGTPMDTWKSIDQEGNLGFLRAARHVHEITRQKEYLDMMVDSAHYEYLWRYGFRANPEVPPLKGSGWNSTGGSVTSVSNPHIHPMGVYVTPELFYLFRHTGDDYHLQRAYDGLFWGLATADLYPETTGYGQLGVMTERYCPSDGLTIETFSDTMEKSSIWFSFNGWAACAVLEGLAASLLEDCPLEGV
ncbi:MAG: hypothetical protein R6W96_04860 [Clostridia bacterium]